MTDNLSSWWSTGLAITMSLSTGLYIWHRQKAQKSRHDLEKRHLKYVNDLPDPATSFWTKIEKIEQIKTEVIKREGRTFALSMLGSTTIMVADAGLVQEITIRHFNNFVNRRVMAFEVLWAVNLKKLTFALDISRFWQHSQPERFYGFRQHTQKYASNIFESW